MNLRKCLDKAPKTSIATIISALLIYWLTQWYIWESEAQLISAILVALWFWINLSSGKFK